MALFITNCKIHENLKLTLKPKVLLQLLFINPAFLVNNATSPTHAFFVA